MFDEPEENMIALFGVNDLPRDCRLHFTVKKVLPGAEPEVVLTGQAALKADSSVEIGKLAISEGEKCFYLIEWELNGKTYKNHYFTYIIDIDYAGYVNALEQCGMDEFEGMD